MEAIKAAQGPAVSEASAAKESLAVVSTAMKHMDNADLQYSTRVKHKMKGLQRMADDSETSARLAAERFVKMNAEALLL